MLLAGLVVEVVIPFSSQSLTERLFSSSTSAPPYSPLYSDDTTLDLLEYAKWRHVGRRREHTHSHRDRGKEDSGRRHHHRHRRACCFFFGIGGSPHRHRRRRSQCPLTRDFAADSAV